MIRPRMRRLAFLVATTATVALGVAGVAHAASPTPTQTAVPAVTAPTPSPSPVPEPCCFFGVPTVAPPPPSPALGGQQAVGVTSSDGAKVVAEKWDAYGHVVDLSITSPAVYGAKAAANPIAVRIVVPTGWTPGATKTWPMALILHGGNDDNTSWTRSTNILQLAENEQLIMVFPSGGSTATYTNYLNPLDGNPYQWETFHMTELAQILDKSFHTGTTRAIMGLSAGGYGSIIYAEHHPGYFKYVSSWSGLYSTQRPDMTSYLLGSSGDDNPFARFGIPGWDAATWNYQDPIYEASNLKGSTVYVSAGLTGLPSAQDQITWTPAQFAEFWSGSTAQDFQKKLQSLNLPATFDLYTYGEHAWASWQVELSKTWPTMMNTLGLPYVPPTD
jgi:diacylglycerol O-acyltransferase/trehalose O-mycolyltransferase